MSKEVFMHGIYPRSERLVTATQGYDRKRVSAQEVSTLQVAVRQALVGLQESEYFSLVEDGKLTWQDIFRPFSTTSQGFRHDEEGEVTRWFDNNSFFRKPVITGRLIPDFPRLDEYFPQVVDAYRWKVTLPSPFTFAKLCEDRTTHKFEDTLENVTGLIKATIEHLVDARGVSFIQFNEPYIPFHGSRKSDIDDLIKSLRSLGVANRKARLGLYSYFGDSAPLAKRLEEEDVIDAIGVDFLQTRIEDLPTSTGHDLIAGVVDGRNSDIENTTELSPFIYRIQEHARPTTLYITHNTDLEFLPEEVARKKIKLIGSLK